MLSTVLLTILQATAPAPSAPATTDTLWWGDWDGDGLVDALAVRPGQPPRLLANRGQGEFHDLTRQVGLPQVAGVRQAVWQDLEGDGPCELLLVSPEHGLALLRKRGGILQDDTAAAGLEGLEGIVHARFLDLDGDALVDLWLAGVGEDHLLRQDAAGSFTAVRLEFEHTDAETIFVARVAPENPTRTPAQPDGESERERAAAPAAPAPHERAGGTPDGRSEALVVGAVVGSTSAVAPPPLFACIPSVKDQATGNCVTTSSLPTLGMLYPLGPELNIDAAGRVGVSTTSPSHRLTVQGVGNDNVLRLIGAVGAFGEGARLNFGDSDYVHLWEYADDRLEVKGQKEVLISALDGSGEINLTTQKVNVAAPGGTRFVSGRVGIGTSALSWPLEILATQAVAKLTSSNSTFGSVIELRNDTASPTNVGALNFVNAAGQFNGQIAYLGSDSLALRTNGGERMRINAQGNVGVGTTVPVRTLDVNGTVRGNAAGGLLPAVEGTSSTTNGDAVYGAYTAATGFGTGVTGTASSPDGTGVFGSNLTLPTSGAPNVTGVFGEARTGLGQGVWGVNWATAPVGSFPPVGVLAQCGSAGWALMALGNLAATGSKSFLQPHPTDASRMVRFACLEGNESGTYCRGSSRLERAVARIEVPEDFRLVTSPDGLTAQITPRGPAQVWVERLDLEQLIVRGSADVTFDWTVHGERRGFEDLETLLPNSAFVPRVKGVPYMTDRSPQFQRILREAGITNDDGTPNEATAAALGWVLVDRDSPEARRILPPEYRNAMPTAAQGALQPQALPTGDPPGSAPQGRTPQDTSGRDIQRKP